MDGQFTSAPSPVTLADLYIKGVVSVDVWSQNHADGYQRAPVVTRARKYARYSSKRGSFTDLDSSVSERYR